MSLPKPTLGFDSRFKAVQHLHSLGLPTITIAHEVSSTRNSVATMLSKLDLPPNPYAERRSGPQALFLELSPDLVPLLRPHAARRGLTCAALAALIVDTVADQGLVDAILDDREAQP